MVFVFNTPVLAAELEQLAWGALAPLNAGDPIAKVVAAWGAIEFGDDASNGDDLPCEGIADILGLDSDGVEFSDLYASVAFLGLCGKRGVVSAFAGSSRILAR